MESMKEKLTEYAQLLVRVGLNIQRGQPLVISSPVECAFSPVSVRRRPIRPVAGRW